MIPNRAYYTWFGKEVPDYLYFSMEKFRYMNRNIDFILLHYTPERFIEDMKSSKPSLVSKTLVNFKEIYKNVEDNYFYNDFKKKCANYTKFRFGYLAVFFDIFKLLLINEVGGIYIDGDTFPIKPFDKKLLDNNCFFTNIDNYLVDINFFGGEKGFLLNFEDIADCYKKATLANFMHNREYCKKKSKYNELREKFYNLKLEIGENFLPSSLSYLDHYFDGEWKKEELATNEINEILKKIVTEIKK